MDELVVCYAWENATVVQPDANHINLYITLTARLSDLISPLITMICTSTASDVNNAIIFKLLKKTPKKPHC